jgi:hypothetical protein
MGLGDTQVGQQKGDRFGSHRGTTIGVKGELVLHDPLFLAGVLDEALGEFRTLAWGHHPADDITAEDIQDDVEVEVRPFGRSEQLGDVPTPKLVGGSGQQFRFLVRRMGELITALPGFTLRLQEAVPGTDGAGIDALIQQSGIDRRRGAILEPLLMQVPEHGGALGRA